jgi:DNA invertase Pin-like site-specific DNA recombinase
MIAYYRVSTKKQGDSGNGLEAQKATVAAHVAKNGCELVAEYVEVETGKKHDLDNRPALRKAVAHAKRAKAVLVVAKLDRLLRSTVVHAMLKTSGLKFVCCDQPDANELTLDILAAVAANEVRTIAERTRAGLAVVKAKGTKLGSHRDGYKPMTEEARSLGRAASAKVRAAQTREAYDDLFAMVESLRTQGSSLRAIATTLNAEGYETRTGKRWNPVQVSRVLAQRAKAIAQGAIRPDTSSARHVPGIGAGDWRRDG